MCLVSVWGELRRTPWRFWLDSADCAIFEQSEQGPKEIDLSGGSRGVWGWNLEVSKLRGFGTSL